MTDDALRQFVIFAHFNLDGVKATLAEHPDWLEATYDWGEGNGTESPLEAAAHVGNVAIARYLLGEGATITPAAAAMLGDKPALEALIDLDPQNANQQGAHGIPLLAHAAFSGDVGLMEYLIARGTRLEGVSLALLNAANLGHLEVVRWALAHGANPAAKNYQDLTAANLARQGGFNDVVALLEG